jgi:hypothetical protein
MKSLIALILFAGLSAYAGPKLHCGTEKTEVDVKSDYYMATDTNQDVDLDLEQIQHGDHTMLVSKAPQTLKYDFDQSSSAEGESTWSLTVHKAEIMGTDLTLTAEIRNGKKKYMKEKIQLKVVVPGDGADSEVYLANKLLTLNGKYVIYNPTEEDGQAFYTKFGENIKSGKMKHRDLVMISISNCRLEEEK